MIATVLENCSTLGRRHQWRAVKAGVVENPALSPAVRGWMKCRVCGWATAPLLQERKAPHEYYHQVAETAADWAQLVPDGQQMAKAAEDARAQALEAVLLWRTAITEMARLVEAEASRARRPTLVGP